MVVVIADRNDRSAVACAPFAMRTTHRNNGQRDQEHDASRECEQLRKHVPYVVQSMRHRETCSATFT